MVCKFYMSWLHRRQERLREELANEYNKDIRDIVLLSRAEDKLSETNRAIIGYVKPLRDLYKVYITETKYS